MIERQGQRIRTVAAIRCVLLRTDAQNASLVLTDEREKIANPDAGKIADRKG